MTDKARLFWFRVFLILLAVITAYQLIAHQSSDTENLLLGRYTPRYLALLIGGVLLSAAIGYAALSKWPRVAITGGHEKAKTIAAAAWLPAHLLIYTLGFIAAPTYLEPFYNQLYGQFSALTTLTLILICLDALRAIIRKPEFYMVLISVLIAAVGAEWGLNRYIRSFPDSDLARRAEAFEATNAQLLRYQPHPYEGYIPAPGWQSPDGLDEINSRGFRGEEIAVPKPDGVYRIVAIGGSTTYGTGVADWHDSYPAQLERILQEDFGYRNVEVINGGVGGHNSWETLANLTYRVLDLEPDLVIVYQNTNDVHCRLVSPETYRGDNTGHRHAWDSQVIEEARASWAAKVPITLWRVIGSAFGWFKTPLGLSIDDVMNVECTGLTAEQSCLGMSLEDALEANPPVYYERNIRNIIAVSRANDAEVLLVSWASNPNMGDYAASPEYRSAYEEQNAVIEGLAGELDTYYFDFAAQMPLDEEYWADSRHLTRLGNHLKAEMIAAYLDGEAAIPEN